MPTLEPHEEIVLDAAAELLFEHMRPEFARDELYARVEEQIDQETFDLYFPEMSAVWRGLAILRGLPVPALGEDYRARISNMDLRVVSAFVHARLTEQIATAQTCPIQRDLFWLMMAPAIVPAEHLLYAITDLALPTLSHNGVPGELIAWVCQVDQWRLVFYTSIPEPGIWLENHDLMPFGGLDYFLHLQHDASDPAGDRFSRFKQGSIGHVWGKERPGREPDVVLMAEHQEALRRDNPVWRLLELEAGFTLGELKRAIAQGQPVTLIRQGAVVLERPID